MRRLGVYTWVLLAAVLATVVLNVVAPEIGIYAAIALVVVLFAALTDGMTVLVPGRQIHERKREVLSRQFRHGRPKWQQTAPDHADEPPDLIWERERARRRAPR